MFWKKAKKTELYIMIAKIRVSAKAEVITDDDLDLAGWNFDSSPPEKKSKWGHFTDPKQDPSVPRSVSRQHNTAAPCLLYYPVSLNYIVMCFYFQLTQGYKWCSTHLQTCFDPPPGFENVEWLCVSALCHLSSIRWHNSLTLQARIVNMNLPW